MAKLRSGTVFLLSDGYQNAMERHEPPRERTDAELVRDELYREIAHDPARVELWDILQAANDLGLDTGDPAIIRRALEAARKRVADRAERTQGAAAWTDLASTPSRDRKHAPVVYYARTGGLVKIGTTTGIGQRMSSLAVQAVMAVEVGSFEVESRRHDQFVHLHDHGEWFRLEADLGRHIADVRETFAAEVGATTEEWLAGRLCRRATKPFVRRARERF